MLHDYKLSVLVHIKKICGNKKTLLRCAGLDVVGTATGGLELFLAVCGLDCKVAIQCSKNERMVWRSGGSSLEQV